MDFKHNIRNMSVIAHVDHGTSSFCKFDLMEGMFNLLIYAA